MAFRLAILTTHPIQYYAPLFQLLAQEKSIKLKVFYSLGQAENQIDKGFGKQIKWDLPLVEGYDFQFLTNTASNKGSDRFNGIKNPDIVNEILNFLPDALLVYGWAYNGHLKILRHFKGKLPLWFRGDSTLLNPQSILKETFRKTWLSWIYKHIDKALYVGSNNRSYYKAFGIKENQLFFMPHAIDNERFGTESATEALQIRARLGVLETDILIVFAGKLEAVKNPLLLIDAFTELKTKNVHLLMVGSGDLEAQAMSKAQTHNKLVGMPRIHFLHFQNQTRMPAIYHCCDLFCLPSNSETWGLAVNEAMASSKAILASDRVGCAIDLVQENKNGLIFKADDVKDLTKKLEILIQNKSNLVTMGIESKRIIAKWSYREQINALKELIN